jgi:hypothetical protein
LDYIVAIEPVRWRYPEIKLIDSQVLLMVRVKRTNIITKGDTPMNQRWDSSGSDSDELYTHLDCSLDPERGPMMQCLGCSVKDTRGSGSKNLS